jgi:hypothetical protein
MKNFQILTTRMRKIIITANSPGEAEKIAWSQYEDGEVLMMISSHTSI